MPPAHQEREDVNYAHKRSRWDGWGGPLGSRMARESQERKLAWVFLQLKVGQAERSCAEQGPVWFESLAGAKEGTQAFLAACPGEGGAQEEGEG